MRYNWAIGMDLFCGVGLTIFHHRHHGRAVMEFTSNTNYYQANEHQGTHEENHMFISRVEENEDSNGVLDSLPLPLALPRSCHHELTTNMNCF